jgi:hypothetical protein
MMYRGVSLGGLKDASQAWDALENPFVPAGTVMDPVAAPEGLAVFVNAMSMQMCRPFLRPAEIAVVMAKFPVTSAAPATPTAPAHPSAIDRAA